MDIKTKKERELLTKCLCSVCEVFGRLSDDLDFCEVKDVQLFDGYAITLTKTTTDDDEVNTIECDGSCVYFDWTNETILNESISMLVSLIFVR